MWWIRLIHLTFRSVRQVLLRLVFSRFSYLCVFVGRLSCNVLFSRICCILSLLLCICVVVSNSIFRNICMVYFPSVWFLVVFRIFQFFVSVLLLSHVFFSLKSVLPVLCFSCSFSHRCFVSSIRSSFSILMFFLSSICLAAFCL